MVLFGHALSRIDGVLAFEIEIHFVSMVFRLHYATLPSDRTSHIP
jgi:hypothetical protein